MDYDSPQHPQVQPGFEGDRAAALMRQRMARSNQQPQQMPMMQGQGSQYAPNLQHRMDPPPPHMQAPRPGPPPPGAPRAVMNMTGSGRKIPITTDPLNKYKNKGIEKEEAVSTTKPDMLIGVNQLVTGIAGIIAFSAVFVLPQQLKVFWVLIVGLTLLMAVGFHIYKELMEASERDGENGEKKAEYAWILLFVLMCIYSAVMLGILVFMAWSLYGIANARTNIARPDVQPIQQQQKHSRREEVYA